MNILITGGAGSLGTALVHEIQKEENMQEDRYRFKDHKIRLLDNNEYVLANIKIQYPEVVRKLYGSITDRDRVRRAMKDIDIVIHCAAMKNLEITEFNTSELIKTNIVGTDVIIQSAIEAGVTKIMFISSDKAVQPTSIYGASKLIGEHTALNYNATSSSKVSVFRSGNFMNSNGNVFESWKYQLEKGLPLTITDIKCMRYFIETNIAAKTILKCIIHMEGGEIFIPGEEIMPELLIINLANKFLRMNNKKSEFNCIGLRKGEKQSELLFNTEEITRRIFNKEIDCWVIK
jgi:FlaA1/EpsC-like NDP-sugar epimerase